jgi:hypothetical protein
MSWTSSSDRVLWRWDTMTLQGYEDEREREKDRERRGRGGIWSQNVNSLGLEDGK